MLDNFIEEIQRLQKGIELLNDIWTDIGTYGENKVEPLTLSRIHDYFGFDDNE